MTEKHKKAYLVSKGCNVELSLSFLEDFEIYDETIRDFLDEAEEKLEELQKYYNSGKMVDYAVVAHSLKSNAKYIGFEKLVDIAYKNELAGKQGDINFIKENYQKLVDETNEVIKVAEEYINMIDDE